MMNDTHVYLAKCRECHAIRGFTRDDPDSPQETAQDVREFLADGRIVERVAWADLPEGGIRFGKHTCGRETPEAGR